MTAYIFFRRSGRHQLQARPTGPYGPIVLMAWGDLDPAQPKDRRNALVGVLSNLADTIDMDEVDLYRFGEARSAEKLREAEVTEQEEARRATEAERASDPGVTTGNFAIDPAIPMIMPQNVTSLAKFRSERDRVR